MVLTRLCFISSKAYVPQNWKELDSEFIRETAVCKIGISSLKYVYATTHLATRVTGVLNFSFWQMIVFSSLKIIILRRYEFNYITSLCLMYHLCSVAVYTPFVYCLAIYSYIIVPMGEASVSTCPDRLLDVIVGLPALAFRLADLDDAHINTVAAIWRPTMKVRKVVKDKGHRVDRWHLASWVCHEFHPNQGKTAIPKDPAQTPAIIAAHPYRLLPAILYLQIDLINWSQIYL